ncbi:MAG: hypothetical protein H6745_01055 [Deltaproteobacteria bacterium]|nr:hypothetical protein [Deltaproteobacteria bacterium]
MEVAPGGGPGGHAVERDAGRRRGGAGAVAAAGARDAEIPRGVLEEDVGRGDRDVAAVADDDRVGRDGDGVEGEGPVGRLEAEARHDRERDVVGAVVGRDVRAGCERDEGRGPATAIDADAAAARGPARAAERREGHRGGRRVDGAHRDATAAAAAARAVVVVARGGRAARAADSAHAARARQRRRRDAHGAAAAAAARAAVDVAAARAAVGADDAVEVERLGDRDGDHAAAGAARRALAVAAAAAGRRGEEGRAAAVAPGRGEVVAVAARAAVAAAGAAIERGVRRVSGAGRARAAVRAEVGRGVRVERERREVDDGAIRGDAGERDVGAARPGEGGARDAAAGPGQVARDVEGPVVRGRALEGGGREVERRRGDAAGEGRARLADAIAAAVAQPIQVPGRPDEVDRVRGDGGRAGVGDDDRAVDAVDGVVDEARAVRDLPAPAAREGDGAVVGAGVVDGDVGRRIEGDEGEGAAPAVVSARADGADRAAADVDAPERERRRPRADHDAAAAAAAAAGVGVAPAAPPAGVAAARADDAAAREVSDLDADPAAGAAAAGAAVGGVGRGGAVGAEAAVEGEGAEDPEREEAATEAAAGAGAAAAAAPAVGREERRAVPGLGDAVAVAAVATVAAADAAAAARVLAGAGGEERAAVAPDDGRGADHRVGGDEIEGLGVDDGGAGEVEVDGLRVEVDGGAADEAVGLGVGARQREVDGGRLDRAARLDVGARDVQVPGVVPGDVGRERRVREREIADGEGDDVGRGLAGPVAAAVARDADVPGGARHGEARGRDGEARVGADDLRARGDGDGVVGERRVVRVVQLEAEAARDGERAVAGAGVVDRDVGRGIEGDEGEGAAPAVVAAGADRADHAAADVHARQGEGRGLRADDDAAAAAAPAAGVRVAAAAPLAGVAASGADDAAAGEVSDLDADGAARAAAARAAVGGVEGGRAVRAEAPVQRQGVQHAERQEAAAEAAP